MAAMNSVHHHPDRRSPYVYDVRDLERRPGALKEVKVDVPAPGDLGYEMISVPQGSSVGLNLKFEAVVEGVLVTGTATAEIRGECARCLDAIEDRQVFELQELYFHPGNEVDEEESLVVDEAIDLEEALRDAVVLELPFTPLCEPDCLGLCQECGFRLNDDPGHEHAAKVDPRWEKLMGLNVGDNN